MEPIDEAFESQSRTHYQAFREDVTIFTPVLEAIHQQLGVNYDFYEECYNAILAAIRAKEDATAWLSQMNMLVRHDSALAISHEGVLFLLRELERIESHRSDAMASPPPSPRFVVPSMPAPSYHQSTHQQQVIRLQTPPPLKHSVFLRGTNQTPEAPFWIPRTQISPSRFQTAPTLRARSEAHLLSHKPLSRSNVFANTIAHGEPIDMHSVKVAFRDYANFDMDQDGSGFFGFTDPRNDAVHGKDYARFEVLFSGNQDMCDRYDSAADDLEEQKNIKCEIEQGPKKDWEGNIECSVE